MIYTYICQALPSVVVHLTVRFSLTKENRAIWTKISTKTDKDGFSTAMFRLRSEKNSNYWMFSSLGLCFVFCCKIYIKKGELWSFQRRFPLVNALEFRCCKITPSANRKATFDGGIERICCIARHDDFSPRGPLAVLLEVAPFVRDCRSRGYRRC